MVYPNISPIIPMIIPTFSISFCWIIPVACAKALGGVLIGNIIASDDPIATPINKVSTPPNDDRFSRILIPAIARIGTSKAAVAVWEIKFAIA